MCYESGATKGVVDYHEIDPLSVRAEILLPTIAPSGLLLALNLNKTATALKALHVNVSDTPDRRVVNHQSTFEVSSPDAFIKVGFAEIASASIKFDSKLGTASCGREFNAHVIAADGFPQAGGFLR